VARNAPTIDAYGGGGFRLAGEWRSGSILILGDEPRAWAVTSMADLKLSDFDEVLSVGAAEVEFVLLGAGARNALPPREVRDGLRAAGIGLEFMDTPAAARLYNLLTSEGRKLAAALIAVA
jgi:uncharacterized protein